MGHDTQTGTREVTPTHRGSLIEILWTGELPVIELYQASAGFRRDKIRVLEPDSPDHSRTPAAA
jgi:hypothetical protein